VGCVSVHLGFYHVACMPARGFVMFELLLFYCICVCSDLFVGFVGGSYWWFS